MVREESGAVGLGAVGLGAVGLGAEAREEWREWATRWTPNLSALLTL